jgi:outer membrane protein
MSLTKGGKNEAVQAEGEAVENVAGAGSIVYIDLDRILMEYDMANDLRSVVETKVQNIQAEVNRRGTKLEKDVKSFQEKMEKGLMTRSVAEVQGQKLQQQEQDFNVYAAQKQQEIQEEQVVMMNQLGDAIKTFLDKYNEEKQYAMILTNQGGAPVITGDAALNITDDVLAGLNEEYIKTKNEKSE